MADNDPVEQEKAMKFNALLTNAVIFHNVLDIAEIARQLLEEGWTIDPEDLAHISPYLTEHINRFGEYSTHELGIQPEAYDPRCASRTRPRPASVRPPERPGPVRSLARTGASTPWPPTASAPVQALLGEGAGQVGPQAGRVGLRVSPRVPGGGR
ncbi:Tn3 family transposase [Streptomyces yanii]|uniref:Tn3 family transposase n=1 Tax=Streptomyces yanii TaxID=78510 RepID=A0ABV5RC57_9ACTN